MRAARTGYRFTKASNFGKAAIAAKLVHSAYKWHQRRKIALAKRRQFTLMDQPDPGTGSAKKFKNGATNFVNQTFDSRELNLHSDILDVPFNTDGKDDINTRNRMLVNVRGIKICFHVINLSQKNITFHFAIVQTRPKQGLHSQGFYRNDGRNGLQRGLNFGSYLTGMDHHCLNLNTDKYIVVKHYKFMICRNHSDGTIYNENIKNFVHFEKYLSLNKQLRFENRDGSDGYGPNLEIIHWADSCDTEINTQPIQNVYSMGLNTITYFREPRA